MTEQQILQQLEQLKQELLHLQQIPEYQRLSDLRETYRSQLQQLLMRHQERKQERDRLRQSYLHQSHPEQLIELQQQSQQDGLEARRFKRDRDLVLKPLTAVVHSAFDRIQAIHLERQALYAELQSQFQQIALEPLTQALPILYEDEEILVIDKPAGMLSVPGRASDRQASVLRYLQLEYPTIQAVHRLDQDTSGILIFAKTLETYQMLQSEFRDRKVKKIYEAKLENPITQSAGIIDLPLWGDPTKRPYQEVNFDRGKPAITEFEKLEEYRIELIPQTGRTHQLRVHMAIGLENPILGDRLYGTRNIDGGNRLCLHAKYCLIEVRGRSVELISGVPF